MMPRCSALAAFLLAAQQCINAVNGAECVSGNRDATPARIPQGSCVPGDKKPVNRFLENAAKIFDAAARCSESGNEISEMTVLIGPEGGISLVAGCDWPLDSLLTHRGARMVFRVSQQESTVRLEGRAGSRTCLFETAKPDGVARHLLAASPASLLHCSAPALALLPGGAV